MTAFEQAIEGGGFFRTVQVRTIAAGMRTAARVLDKVAAVRAWGGPRIKSIDHLTLPVKDLAQAERFYTRVLGGTVLFRVGEEPRPDDPEQKRYGHISMLFGADGPRVDLFEQPWGQTPVSQPHPHLAFHVEPEDFDSFRTRLKDAGVPSAGPLQMGPPGQASVYFNDPSGNHLEFATIGYVPKVPQGIPQLDGLAYEWQG